MISSDVAPTLGAGPPPWNLAFSASRRSTAIVGVGLARGWTAVRWSLVGEIALSWVLTLPGTIGLGYVIAAVLQALLGTP